MAGSFYVLSEAESLGSVRSQNDTIVASGPWIKGAGELPHRIVMREFGGEIVVHSQVINDSFASYWHGNYFPSPLSIEPESDCTMEDAWDVFESRVRRSLGIEAKPKEPTND